MARGRHRRRSGLLARLALLRRRPSELALLRGEVARLRALQEANAAATSAALLRAVRAEDRAVEAEAGLSRASEELAGLRADLAALREELVWAFAAQRVDAAEPGERPQVIDLRDSASA